LLTGDEDAGACWEHVLPSGGRVTLQAISTNQARVVAVNSTNLQDYLASRWQPGKIVNMMIN